MNASRVFRQFCCKFCGGCGIHICAKRDHRENKRKRTASFVLVSNLFSLVLLELLKVVWYPQYGPKSLFKYGEERSIVCYCTQEEKLNF